MINFPCRCGQYQFSVPFELAGDTIQCPVCNRLNDVPTLSDLSDLEETGGYKIGAALDRHEDPKDRLASVARAFTRGHLDEHGQEIDLRPTFDDVLAAGTDDRELERVTAAHLDAPRYDPETGELIPLLDIKTPQNVPPPIDPGGVPMAHRAVQYASPELFHGQSYTRIGSLLLEPANLFVMLIVLIAHVIFEGVFMITAGPGVGLLVAPIWIVLVIFLMSHYGNIPDEIGPSDKDELPRPLRDLSIYDDIWGPFVHVAGAGMLCFLPAKFALSHDLPSLVVLALLCVGAFVFPAVVLTLTTSGTSLNLRPDRVLAVIRKIGAAYPMLALLFAFAGACYAFGLWRLHFDAAMLFVSTPLANLLRASIPWFFAPWVGYPALVIGIVLMHWFFWAMGIAYRLHHDEFPWILQRHIATKMQERMQPRRSGHLPGLDVGAIGQNRANTPPVPTKPARLPR